MEKYLTPLSKAHEKSRFNTAKSLLVGLGLALFAISQTNLSFYFSVFSTLVHEVGHSLFAWLFGVASIPAFDFQRGGGMSYMSEGKSHFILGMVVVLYLYLLFRWRAYKRVLWAIGGVALFQILLYLSGWDDALITFMGHGFELLFVVIMGYRGLTGYACKYSLERPLYLFMSLFLYFYNIRFCYRLLFDEYYLRFYLSTPKGVPNDLVSLANNFFGGDLHFVVMGLFILTVLSFPLTLAVYMHTPLLPKARSKLGLAG